jgi:hypothetical protein
LYQPYITVDLRLGYQLLIPLGSIRTGERATNEPV